MKKVFSVLSRIICGFLGIYFLLCSIGGIINCFINPSIPIVLCLLLTFIFAIIGILLTKIAFNKKTSTGSASNVAINNIPDSPTYQVGQSAATCSVNTQNEPTDIEPSPSIHSEQYVEHNGVIFHPDGSSITDEEVPYLVQLGYEEALQREGIYDSEMLDLPHINNDLQSKRFQTAIPSYQELCNISANTSNVPMLSTDIFFLKYLDGRILEHPNIAQYWYYEYDINYSIEIKKLISSGLLTISQINLKRFKVDDLKNILRHFELPLSGKKADLQKRILENISLEELSSFLGDSTHYFCATDTGSELIKTVHDSATFNLELENEALSLILDYDYEDAFNLIWHYKKQTPAEKNTHYNYNPAMDELYDSIMIPCGFFYTLKKDRDIEENLRAAIVFCRMYGLGQDKVRKLIMRIYMESGHDFSEDAKNLINGRLL